MVDSEWVMRFKEYIARQLIGKTLHFKCDCLLLPLDHDGLVKDYEIVDGEIVWKVLINDKLISIGENHPKLFIECF